MRLLIMAFLMIMALNGVASDTTRLYNPYAHVTTDVQKALMKAKKEKKHVLLQIGGNWCIWCYRFHSFVHLDTTLKKLLENNYVIYHLNYSKENKNLDYLKKLGFPQRFGFPVLVVLDAEGNRLHTQDTALLEKGNGYDHGKVKSFLNHWAPVALDAVFYKE